MTSEQFRRQLRQESEKWWSEGLIDAALYEKLAARYQLDRLEKDASNRFITILMGLGAILLGLGAITFVAANWQIWSRSFKLIVLLGCFVGVNATGFYLWRRPTSIKGQQRLGQGLLLLGAMLLGANMALMSQMFHQTGAGYELLLVWGLGVAAMAYSLRLTSQGVLALLLVGCGYLWGLADAEAGWSAAIVHHLAIVVGLVFVPLAYWCRSRVLFSLAAVAIAAALSFNLMPLFVLGNTWIMALAFALPPALLWSYNGWRFSRAQADTPPDSFQPIARSLAVVFFSVLFYSFSFGFWWNFDSWFQHSSEVATSWNWALLIDPAIFSFIAGMGWLQVRHQLRQIFRIQERAINSGTIAILIIATALLFVNHIAVAKVPGLGEWCFNLMLFLLSLGLVRDGLAVGQRRTFWGGMVLLVVGIVTRVLEYDTGLLLKAIVFAICGAGIIAAGLWFERKTSPDSSQPTAQEDL